VEFQEPIDDRRLKNCPFCGKRPIGYYEMPHEHEFMIKGQDGKVRPILPASKGAAYIECPECGAMLAARTTEEAVEAWNGRANERYCDECGYSGGCSTLQKELACAAYWKNHRRAQ
jgi:DNA-directed RNA polymerase subunit M/transcription elongation factor TFIIS